MPSGLSVTTFIPNNYTTITTLTWNRSADAQTPSSGLSYNIYLGSEPGLSDRIAPMSELSSGFRKVITLGNTGQDTTWTIHNLGGGDFFWSVQAIDNGFLASSFAPEETFTITGVGMEEASQQNATIAPNPACDRIRITVPSVISGRIDIYNIYGDVILSAPFSTNQTTLNVSDLSEGLYVVRVSSSENIFSGRFIKVR